MALGLLRGAVAGAAGTTPLNAAAGAVPHLVYGLVAYAAVSAWGGQ